jgi:hypothetical protein
MLGEQSTQVEGPVVAEETRSEFIANLRTYADWLEAHPEAGTPSSIHSINCALSAKEMLGMARRIGGQWEKDATPEMWFELVRHFGPSIKHGIFIGCEKVCERVVVGIEEVEVEGPDPTVVASPNVRRVEKREKVEWRCPESLSALAGGDAA